jgi:hypothetical protein
MLPTILTDNSLTVVIDCVPHVVPRTHPNFDKVLEAIATEAESEEILSLINIPKAIETFMQGNVTIRDRVVYYKGVECHNYLASHILRFMEANDPSLVAPLVAFLDNVMENPSYRAVQGLYEWAQKSNLPITSDGHLLAWKIVGADYRDLHSRRFDNSVGNIVEQPRNLCDEDPDQTCSAGLHFCSYEYLPHYGNGERDKIVIVKINPRDVVAIPRDYSCAKGRCCRYEVVGEVPFDKVREYFPENTYVWEEFEFEDDDEDFEPDVPDVELEVGQRWRTRNGTIGTITNRDRHHLFPFDVHYDDGDENSVTIRGTRYEYNEDPYDLIELLPDILPGQVDMKVGQVWETKDGAQVTVTAYDHNTALYGAVYRLSDGVFVWNKNGDGYADVTPGEGHLKRLIRDVD